MAINPGHNGSTAVVSDGELVYYAEEERYSREKYDANPFRGMIHALTKYKIDNIVIGGTQNEFGKVQWSERDYYTALIKKYQPKAEIEHAGNNHHYGHACATFYNSGFDEALVIIVDGCGSFYSVKHIDPATPLIGGYETESIFAMSYLKESNLLMKICGNGNTFPFKDDVTTINDWIGVVKHTKVLLIIWDGISLKQEKQWDLHHMVKKIQIFQTYTQMDLEINSYSFRNIQQAHGSIGLFQEMKCSKSQLIMKNIKNGIEMKN